MKILLDHNINRRFASHLGDHEVATAYSMGWEQLGNGDLLVAAAAEGFEVLITVDKKLRREHDLASLPVGVLELDVLSQRLDRLLALLPFLPDALQATRTHRFVSLKTSGEMQLLAKR